MTIASVVSRVDYLATGSVDNYSYTFKIFDEGDLLVTIRDTLDVETTLSLSTDYTVAGVGDAGGGSITLVDMGQSWFSAGGLVEDYTITIRRVVDIVQETDIRNQGAFFPEVHENQFDKLVMIDQQQQDQIDGSLRLPESINPDDVSTLLPVPSAGKVIGWNNTEDGLVNLSGVGTVNVSSFMETVLDDTTASAARVTLDAAQLVASRSTLSSPATGDLVGVTDISAASAETKITLTALKTFLDSIAIVPTISIATPSSHSGGFSANGTGTYTTPANVRYVRIRLSGPGGGGASGQGSAASNSGANGSASTTFGSSLLTATAGQGSVGGTGLTSGGAGGSATINSPAVKLASNSGGNGSGTMYSGGTNSQALQAGGGVGGVNALGGAGGGGGITTSGGTNGVPETGAGGGGGGSGSNNSSYGGGGGGAGGYIEAIISGPSATYAYAIGSGGAGGAATSGCGAGGNGGSGIIIIEEYYS